MSPRTWQMVEGALVGVGALVGTVVLGFPWWLPFALFLTWDLSAVGYLASPRVGAFTYNLVHNYGSAAVAGVVAALTSTPWLGAVALAWALHVGVDRALGYGLKHGDDFQHTHLGWIGKARKAREAEH
jgi:hypothetical protein